MRKLALTQVGEKPGVKFEAPRDAKEFFEFLKTRAVAAQPPAGPSHTVLVPELNMPQLQKLVQEWNYFGTAACSGTAAMA